MQAEPAPTGQLPVCQSSQLGLEAPAVCTGGYKLAIDLGETTAGVSEVATSAASNIRYMPVNRLAFRGPNGEPCSSTGYRPEEPATAPPAPGQRVGELLIDTVAGAFPSCPVARSAEADPTSPSSPQTYAVEYWNEIPLPKPQPHIAPGRAITGMLAYLETRGTTTHTYTEPTTPFGPLTIARRASTTSIGVMGPILARTPRRAARGPMARSRTSTSTSVPTTWWSPSGGQRRGASARNRAGSTSCVRSGVSTISRSNRSRRSCSGRRPGERPYDGSSAART